MTKPIRLSVHARERAQQRGAEEAEILEAISEGNWEPADRGRLQALKVFPYHAEWNGR